MKKILVALAVLMMAAPVPADVNFSCEKGDDVNEIIVSFENTVPANKIRAISIDICVSDGNIVDVNCTVAGYTTYPGSIDISDDGEVDDEGTCVCSPSYPGTLGDDANCVTLEMGSLHIGDANAPPQSGELVRFRIHPCDGAATVDINDNIIRGGVVMEDPNEYVTTNLPISCEGCEEPNCYLGMADEAEWVIVGKPECWCYPRQCDGDADGQYYGEKTKYYVSIPDLTILKAAWNKTAAQLVGDEACADFDHLYYGEKTKYRVSIPDLTILKAYWNIPNGPDPNCSPGNRNP